MRKINSIILLCMSFGVVQTTRKYRLLEWCAFGVTVYDVSELESSKGLNR